MEEDLIKASTIEKKSKHRFAKRRQRKQQGKESSTTKNEAWQQESITLELFKFRSPHLTLKHANLVVQQLGYIPYNLIEVAAFTERTDGSISAAVLLLYPLNRNDLTGRYSANKDQRPLPFPTTMWLACSELHTKISNLEDQGYIATFLSMLQSPTENGDDNEWLLLMRQAHKSYAEERWGLLSEDDKAMVISNGWESKLREVGIAGISNFDSVKCLHCHYAHYLARPKHRNIIGEWTHHLLQQQNTQPQRYTESSFLNSFLSTKHHDDLDHSNDPEEGNLKSSLGPTTNEKAEQQHTSADSGNLPLENTSKENVSIIKEQTQQNQSSSNSSNNDSNDTTLPWYQRIFCFM